jgi:hypothetical protein
LCNSDSRWANSIRYDGIHLSMGTTNLKQYTRTIEATQPHLSRALQTREYYATRIFILLLAKLGPKIVVATLAKYRKHRDPSLLLL